MVELSATGAEADRKSAVEIRQPARSSTSSLSTIPLMSLDDDDDDDDDAVEEEEEEALPHDADEGNDVLVVVDVPLVEEGWLIKAVIFVAMLLPLPLPLDRLASLSRSTTRREGFGSLDS